MYNYNLSKFKLQPAFTTVCGVGVYPLKFGWIIFLSRKGTVRTVLTAQTVTDCTNRTKTD